MDANGTRFNLLVGKSDWGRALPVASEGAHRSGRLLGDPLPVRPGPSLAEFWGRSAGKPEQTGLHWDSENHELTLAPQLFQFKPLSKSIPPKLQDRRGAGRDRYGNWYWIAEDEMEIMVQSSGSGTTSHFWSSAADCNRCEPEPQFGSFAPVQPAPAIAGLKLRGLAVTDDHFLVAGVLEPAGLLIFDLHAGGGPLQTIWPEEVAFTPYDIAQRPGGGVFILDRNPADPLKGTRYWALDRHFNVQARHQSEMDLNPGIAEAFKPVGGEPRTPQANSFPQGISLESASPVSTLNAIAIEALPDHTVLILDRDEESGFSRIYRYGFEGEIGEAIGTNVFRGMVVEAEREKFRFTAHDFAFVAEHESNGKTIPDRLYVVEEKGDQSYAFNVSLSGVQLVLEPLQAFLPMRLFGGKGLVSAAGQAWYDFSDRWIPLVEQPRPRYETEAALETPVFDGGEPDCRWHRLMIDGRIAPEAKVDVWTRAANDKKDLPFTEYRQEPGLYRRRDGSEIPFSSIRGAGAGNATAEYATWELLFQRARGRYIQIKLKLSGNGRTTPRLRALRAYFPRFSYLDHYLPAIYREEAQPASFLDRFLANIEGFFTSIEDRIAAVQVLFDFRSVPGENLDWLAGWFGIVLDPSWNDLKRRLFIRHAMDFFQYRGTIHGLNAALRLALEDCADESVFDVARSLDRQRNSIRIIENYRVRQTPGVVLGDPTSVGAAASGGLPQTDQASRWTPANERSDLYARYSAYLQKRFAVDLPPLVRFSLRNFDWQKLNPSPGGATMLTLATEANDATLWRSFLKKRYATIAALNFAQATNFADFDAVIVPENLSPAGAALADWNDFIAEKSAAWRDFAQQTIGYVPRALGSERTRWRDFLARRYRRILVLNNAWNTSWAEFDAIPLFDELPPGKAALTDWSQFESVVLAIEAAAHRFTVLLPVPPNRDQNEFRQRRELAERIANWEKPAHTVFDVKFYWTMFRVGAARLNYDTLLDSGSRVPQLLTPLVVGQGYLAEGYVADARDLSGRIVIGRGGIPQRQQVG